MTAAGVVQAGDVGGRAVVYLAELGGACLRESLAEERDLGVRLPGSDVHGVHGVSLRREGGGVEEEVIAGEELFRLDGDLVPGACDADVPLHPGHRDAVAASPEGGEGLAVSAAEGEGLQIAFPERLAAKVRTEVQVAVVRKDVDVHRRSDGKAP